MRAEYVIMNAEFFDRNCLTFEDAKERASQRTEQERQIYKIFKLVGQTIPGDAIYEPLDPPIEPVPAPAKPRRKVLDVMMEQRECVAMATLKYVSQKFLAENSESGRMVVCVSDGKYKVCLMGHFKIYQLTNNLTVGNIGTFSAAEFSNEAEAAEYVERITKLVDEINAKHGEGEQ